MNDKPEQLIKKLYSLMARQSVLENLVLAMFDAIPDQTLVINEFSATTSLSNILDKQDSKPEEFRLAFQQYRTVMLEILHHAMNRAKA